MIFTGVDRNLRPTGRKAGTNAMRQRIVSIPTSVNDCAEAANTSPSKIRIINFIMLFSPTFAVAHIQLFLVIICFELPRKNDDLPDFYELDQNDYPNQV